MQRTQNLTITSGTVVKEPTLLDEAVVIELLSVEKLEGKEYTLNIPVVCSGDMFVTGGALKAGDKIIVEGSLRYKEDGTKKPCIKAKKISTI